MINDSTNDNNFPKSENIDSPNKQIPKMNGPSDSNMDKDKKRPSNHSIGSGQHRNSAMPLKKEEKKEVDIFQQIDEEKEVQKCPILVKILDNTIFNIYINCITIYALFGDDIRIMAFQKDADIIFDVITITALASFTIEITMSVFSKPQYKFSFFFWLDIMSTLSLIFDIQMVSNALFFSGGQATNTVNLARAGRASRVGTKAGRVVRLVRLIRIVKLYKASTDQRNKTKKKMDQWLAKKAKNKENKEFWQENFKQQQMEDEKKMLEEEQKKSDQKESRVSKKLSDLTTKRVIVIVLSLLLIMPMFNSDYYFDIPNTVHFQTHILRDFLQNDQVTWSQFNTTFAYLREYGNKLDTETAKLYTPFGQMDDSVLETLKKDYDLDLYNYNGMSSSDFNNLRQTEVNSNAHTLSKTSIENNVKPDEPMVNGQTLMSLLYQTMTKEGMSKNEKIKSTQIQISINIRSTQIFSSGLSLGRTLFVCVVLTMGALLFSKDANDLALKPIERMIDKVNKIARNPNDAKNQEIIIDNEQYETVIIENAITKIGTLLALGFGDAGSEIIGSNMQKVGDVDPLIDGQKKVCIYGFCDIRNFTDATEQLQGEVMLFVNNIGSIVHSVVDRYQGAANKNIGDAFLLVWKLQDSKVKIGPTSPEEMNNERDKNKITYLDQKYASIMADYAALSFVKVQCKINREPKVLQYREHPKLLERFPDYKVRIGYGLHIGWSIEGAIGSEFKIDASYLSPNVKMSERLEGTTKTYGVPLLISQDLQERMTDQMKLRTRLIDRVKFKGTDPLNLYTIDMDVSNLEPCKKANEKEDIQFYQQICKFKKVYLQQKLEYKESAVDIQEFKDQKDQSNNLSQSKQNMGQNDKKDQKEWSVEHHIENSKSIRILFHRQDMQFIKEYSEAVQKYLDGNWQEARVLFKELEQRNPDDQPLKVVMDYMSEFQFNKPNNWQYRELND